MRFGDYISAATMGTVMMVAKAVVAVIVGFVLASLFSHKNRQKSRDRYEDFKRQQTDKRNRDPDKKYAYDSMEEEMLATGIKYRMGSDFTPFDYVMFRVGMGLLAGILSMVFNPWYFPFAFVGVFVIIPIYFRQQDNNDNEDMLPDIGRMLSVLALQIKNGVYISRVVYECYRIVENPRLKQALRELSVDIDNFASIEQAASLFKKKFNNQHTENFAKVLEQLQDTGRSVEFFEDMAASVERINERIVILEEKKAERVSGAFQLILFLSPLIIVFYILLTYFSGSQGLF